MSVLSLFVCVLLMPAQLQIVNRESVRYINTWNFLRIGVRAVRKSEENLCPG